MIWCGRIKDASFFISWKLLVPTSKMEKAESEYDEIISLHLALLKGKEEREKSQYYNQISIKPSATIEKGSYFLEKLVKPYIKLIKELMKEW